MGLAAHAFDLTDDAIDRIIGGMGCHHDNHESAPKITAGKVRNPPLQDSVARMVKVPHLNQKDVSRQPAHQRPHKAATSGRAFFPHSFRATTPGRFMKDGFSTIVHIPSWITCVSNWLALFRKKINIIVSALDALIKRTFGIQYPTISKVLVDAYQM
jgi:hypothetical protein